MENNVHFLKVSERNDTWVKAMRAIEEAFSCASALPEYPENNALLLELQDMAEGLKTRLVAYAKTTDKHMMVRIHQMDVILGGGLNENTRNQPVEKLCPL